MKKIMLLLTVCALLAAAAANAEHPKKGEHPGKAEHPAKTAHPMKTESGWFNLQDCQFCKNLVADPGLLPHLTWESHKIGKGMVQISTVDPAYAASYGKAQQAMEKLGTEMMNGTVNPMTVTMCGSCTEFGQIMMAGAKMENVDGEAADVTVVTTDDPALVARIHKYCERNKAEMALMMGADHGHGHAH